MKVKTADLIDAPLDWAVAQCKGFKKIYAMPAWSNKHGAHGGPQVMVSNEEDSSFDYRPSTTWVQGGPIIEREKLEVRANDYEWQAFCFGFPSARAHSGQKVWASGPTPLIAAMRCFVASRLGDEVDVPDELV